MLRFVRSSLRQRSCDVVWNQMLVRSSYQVARLCAPKPTHLNTNVSLVGHADGEHIRSRQRVQNDGGNTRIVHRAPHLQPHRIGPIARKNRRDLTIPQRAGNWIGVLSRIAVGPVEIGGHARPLA
jgi:hypothetical protein